MVGQDPGRRRADRSVSGQGLVDRSRETRRVPRTGHEIEVERGVQLARPQVHCEALGVGEPDLADEDADRLLHDAIDVIREYDRASASLLQRRLKVGYARAARMIDQLEARGYIGAFDGSNARPVLRREASPSVDDGVVDPDGDDR